MVENSLKGPLPVVGRDGREAWRVYARPFDPLDKRPRISVVLYGLGTSGAATRTAIQGMPGAITLAFSPYADGLGNWIADARAAGHEILLMVPMEPRNYPDYDPGPQALLTSLTEPENTERLEWMLGRGVGYVGVTDFMGSRFTNSTPHMRALFRDLKKRGLMFLESSIAARAISGDLAAASKVPFASNSLYIDSQASRPAIDGQLAEAERLAKQLGAVVVMGFPYPVTLERIAKWAATVEKRGIALAPVSAIAKRRN
ncbi:MAG: divergent polysaccharide deacetylase family protein [Proteobacteria bacterium]|nr:divergent polysaccharide deacetylase family protein [Pseudomonadota bacterium]MDA1323928.1 divergent polysaccharide deacetylase family protein [Pseudomonadota bacterium]